MTSADILTLAGLALSVCSLILAVIFYFRPRRRRELRFAYSDETLQVKTHQHVQLMYDGKPIRGLWQVRVAFWNAATEEIRAADMPGGRYPKLQFAADCHILSAKVIAAAGDANAISCISSEQAVEVHFDYLDPRDGGVVEILYDRPSSDERHVYLARDFDVDGTIIGAGRPSLYEFIPVSAMLAASPFVAVAGIVIVFAWCVMAVIPLVPEFPFWLRVFASAFTIVGIFGAAQCLTLFRRALQSTWPPRFARKSLPKWYDVLGL